MYLFALIMIVLNVAAFGPGSALGLRHARLLSTPRQRVAKLHKG